MCRRFEESLIVAVRAAAGNVRDIAERFHIREGAVLKIKHGVAGYWLPYTPTIIQTAEDSRKGRSKLNASQVVEIKAYTRRDWASARAVAAANGVTPLRVMEIWREFDFFAAKWAFEHQSLAANA